MDFYAVLDQVLDLLRQRGRVTYNALKRQFGLGDGIMAPLGAPIAHEDHALRACYAALAMQAAMQPYTEEVRRSRGLELRMRVGLNSRIE